MLRILVEEVEEAEAEAPEIAAPPEPVAEEAAEPETAEFEPATAQHVRLNLLEATDVPTIWEVQLFEK